MRYLGIDFGTGKVGLALSDEGGQMGFPHSVLKNDPRLMETLRAFIAQNGVAAIVFGDSRDSKGEPNAVTHKAHEFAEALREQTGLPVYFEPEAFTTQEARRDPEGLRTKTSKHTDASAASLILTSYLSRSHD